MAGRPCFSSFRIIRFLLQAELWLAALLLFVACTPASCAGESYQIRFQHQLTNKENRAVSDLTVVLALPASCESQQIDELKPESDCRSTRISLAPCDTGSRLVPGRLWEWTGW